MATGAGVCREFEHGIDRVVQLPDSVLVYGWQRMTVESGVTLRKLDNLSLAGPGERTRSCSACMRRMISAFQPKSLR